MTDDGARWRAPGRPGARTGARVVVPMLLAGALIVAVVPTALADEADRAFPSREQVAAAEERVAAKVRDVGAIQASLLLANQRLEQAAVEAEMASEAYNGTLWRLDQARQELATARSEAAAARRTAEEQRRAIGLLVATSYQQGADIAAVTAIMGADGPEGVLDQYATFQGLSEKLQADFDRFTAAEVVAQGFEERAERARRRAVSLAEEARTAKEAAAAAASSAQETAARTAEEKDRLIRELARAQNISVSLARQRQTALEEVARERAAERARAAAEEAARQEAARDRAAARRASRAAQRAEDARRAEERTAEERRDDQDSRPQAPRPTPSSPPAPASPPPAPAPPPPPLPPGGSGGADRAIAFAKAQLGEPYVWGAAGPDAWDCSGLMLQAWAQSGVSLPHYSVAQYYAGRPISSSSLRPGDLVFWGTSSNPESIHHVAMYIGGGQIIHAPRTGRPVSIDSMYYWTPPNFFARV
ncbi:MAG TPA: C40 family peptidase [Nocardioidaceae bacterium]